MLYRFPNVYLFRRRFPFLGASHAIFEFFRQTNSDNDAGTYPFVSSILRFVVDLKCSKIPTFAKWRQLPHMNENINYQKQFHNCECQDHLEWIARGGTALYTLDDTGLKARMYQCHTQSITLHIPDPVISAALTFKMNELRITRKRQNLVGYYGARKDHSSGSKYRSPLSSWPFLEVCSHSGGFLGSRIFQGLARIHV